MSQDTTPADDPISTDESAAPKGEPRWRRRPLLRAVGAVSALGLTAPLTSRVGRAEHETDPCPVTIDFNRTQVAHVFDVAAEDITSLTVFYFDRDGDAQKQEDIDPTTNDDYGDAPLRVRYDTDEDKTTIQIGGREAAIRRIVAYGPECRSAKTNPLDEAAGDNDDPIADFTWEPDPGVAHEPVTFTSLAEDPDGELIHHGWDFDGDGEEDATGEEVTHTFTTAGDHDVTHTVVDDFDATDSETKTVSVRLPWAVVDKLSASDGDNEDLFGYSVAMDGNTAVIGARRDEDPNGRRAGSAYVFTRSDRTWSEQQKLDASDGDDNDQFGRAVAIDGDTAVIGAPGAIVDPKEPGSAYVYTRSDGTWNEQQKLNAPDGDSGDRFGNSVALNGETAVIGAPADEDPKGEEAGSAYVFTRSDGTWNEQQKLHALDGDPEDWFGNSVAIDGDTAVIGARFDEDPKGELAGSAYVFTRTGDSWSQQAKLSANDGDDEDQFGKAVALDGDTTLVGAHRDDDPNGYRAGSAYVFTRSGDSWSQQAKLSANDGDKQDRFGNSVALDGDTAVIGAYIDEDFAAGSAYVFTQSGDGWDQQRKLQPDDLDDQDGFGNSVAVEADTTLIGSPGNNNPNGPRSGAVYVFRE